MKQYNRLGGVAVGRWTRDQEVSGLTPTATLFGQQPWASCSQLMYLCSPSSISWYLARAFMLKAPCCWQRHRVQWTRGYCRAVLRWFSNCKEPWYKSSTLPCNRVTDTATTARTKLPGLPFLTANRHGHICHLPTDTSVSQAVQLSAEVLAGSPPAADWKHSPGRLEDNGLSTKAAQTLRLDCKWRYRGGSPTAVQA